jgi:hypothetical protein
MVENWFYSIVSRIFKVNADALGIFQDKRIEARGTQTTLQITADRGFTKKKMRKKFLCVYPEKAPRGLAEVPRGPTNRVVEQVHSMRLSWAYFFHDKYTPLSMGAAKREDFL